MAVTWLDQETQIKNTAPVALYDDTVVPSAANYETAPVSLKDDLNSIRSQLQNFLNRNGATFPVANWYDDCFAPTTFENGSKRGINETNQQLHDLERKRVLVTTVNLTDVVVPANVQATGVLTLTANAANTETVTTGTKTYTFQTVLTNVDGNVLIGATASDSLDNLIAAINLGAGSGTLYAAATTANTFVSAAAGAGDTMNATALLGGTQGNYIATTEGLANGSWGAALLTGGTGDISVLTLGQLPSNTTAAVGSVTTLGTVVASNAVNFPNISLNSVSGTTAIAPKNLVLVVDGSTRDPVLSSNRQIYALMQTETATDGHTMTGTTPFRAMLSYVRLNSTGDGLEFCPSTDIAGKTINYSSITRKALEDLTEQDFLRGAELDVTSSSATVTRQNAYDNQGTAPVNLTNNATLDIEGAGLFWKIRDDLEADLFVITEGSAGGTSTVAVSAATDFFDVNAVDNDFLNGAKFDTGAAGTTINIGVTANQIDSGGALTILSAAATDLRLVGSGEMFLDDGNQTGSTWAQTNGIKLSDTTAEWDLFETNFGEVSLLNAIVQAKNSSSHRKVYATVTADVAADVDISLGDGNLDVTLGDLSAGSFLSDYDIFHNGSHQYNGANAAANKDVYPGTSLITGQLKFEKKIKTGDIIIVVDRAFGP
jgi:hypothetical protein